jgi:CheY-like chemotaxis protein
METAPAAAGEKRGGKRILLVDDDHEIIESMRAVLESRGYQILVARDGNQGLVLAEGQEPDLVVLDMMMPKRSGFLVLEKLRRSRPNPMRVIMITANEGSRHKAYGQPQEVLGPQEDPDPVLRPVADDDGADRDDEHSRDLDDGPRSGPVQSGLARNGAVKARPTEIS